VGDKQAGSDISTHENELLLNTGVPDYVRLPPELGSHLMKVISAFITKCPKCDAEVRHLELGDNYYVAECLEHKFVWYARKVQ
jgi:hypothetical protein